MGKYRKLSLDYLSRALSVCYFSLSNSDIKEMNCDYTFIQAVQCKAEIGFSCIKYLLNCTGLFVCIVSILLMVPTRM